MKKVYQLLAVGFLALSTLGASAQNSVPVHAPRVPMMVKGTNPRLGPPHKVASNSMWAFLDYWYCDSVLWSPSYVGGAYIQDMNNYYNLQDTGASLQNQLLIHYCAVSFDTILDAATLTGYTQGSVYNYTLDTLIIPIGHENYSGLKDTLTVQVNSVNSMGMPNPTVLWSTQIITDTGLSYTNNWLYTYNLVLTPNLVIAGNGGKFAVTLRYNDASKLDTMGFLYKYPTYTCTNPAFPFPDTTYIGSVVSGSFGKITANSYTTGYQYFYSPKNPSNPPMSLPNTTYGDFIGYPCASPSNLSANPFQDIIMYAEVSWSPTGVNEVADHSFSVNQNYPNPFNQNTQITYNLTKASDVLFTVYDMTGRELINTNYSTVAAGQHVINLQANQFTPGVYFYSFNVNGTKVTKKMVITE